MSARLPSFALFCHSLVSDWNHGNAHFLRGIVRELRRRGHCVRVFEPRAGWSRTQLVQEHGRAALAELATALADLPRPLLYDPEDLDLDRALEGADVVLVHEWTSPDLVRRIGRHRIAGGRYRLLFHDTHHRAISDAGALAELGLASFDGVLAFGEALREHYLTHGWGRRVWTWHEAADTATFYPRCAANEAGDLVWIGNWGDEERTRELSTFLLEPVRDLGLSACAYGVRYPADARLALADAGIGHGGWLPNHRVPETYARFRVTLHIPRRYYACSLPGIPTIRVFEALACGMPLVCAPWEDTEGLFRRDRDFLVARDGEAMRRQLRLLLEDRDAAQELARCGRETVLARHTCRHRADELLAIVDELGVEGCAGTATPAVEVAH